MVSENKREIEKVLWETADTLGANTGLKPAEFSTTVLGVILLPIAEIDPRGRSTHFRREAGGLVSRNLASPKCR